MSRTAHYDMDGNEVYNSAWPDELNYEETDVVNEPNHYKHGDFETIDEMIIMFGVEAVISYCKINAWKYRARANYKGNFEQDMEKANTYLKFAYELESNLYDVPLLKSK